LSDGLIPCSVESYGCLSFVSVVCCQVEVCATVWSLVNSSPIDVCLFWGFCVFRCLCFGLITCTEISYGYLSVVRVVSSLVEVFATPVLWYRGVQRISVCFDCCVLSGRGLCDGLFPCTEESYGCLSVLIIVWYQLEVCATGWSLVQRSLIDICLFLL